MTLVPKHLYDLTHTYLYNSKQEDYGGDITIHRDPEVQPTYQNILGGTDVEKL